MGRAHHGLLRRRALGTEAIYRVLADHGATLQVEVVRAPGLKAGRRLTLTREAASAMEALEVEPAELPASGRRRVRPSLNT